jgi:hypothetical protein
MGLLQRWWKSEVLAIGKEIIRGIEVSFTYLTSSWVFSMI